MADEPAPDLEDLGEPIAELRELSHEPPPGFVARLLDRLRRRDLSRQLTTLGWTGFGAVFVEFLKLVFSAFEPSPRDEGGPE
ncbi:MAG: hypothetical protein HKN72_09435 [Gemmatimonadetes bacterium]|nr:hypothetical protein [Gemmatimonadota bacterium]NNL30662.1 hypothetical protein [Gemmatimonadota bacterium]